MVQQRYVFKYHEECSSWLKSHKTGYEYCASPPIAMVKAYEYPKGPPVEPLPKEQQIETVAALSKRGEYVYEQVCTSCHQDNGMGDGVNFPPLAGSHEYFADKQVHAGIIVNGLQGKIEVQGKEYNGVMAAWGALDDYDIAAVATYERGAWGNADAWESPDDVLVTIADVKAVRQ